MVNREEHYEVTVRYYDDGAVEAVFWKQNGVGHRLGGPATQWFDRQGRIVHEIWQVNGKLHRPYQDGPATMQIDPVTRVVISEAYCYEGKLHRIGGPALIHRRHLTGEVSRARFHYNGVSYQPSRADRLRMLKLTPTS